MEVTYNRQNIKQLPELPDDLETLTIRKVPLDFLPPLPTSITKIVIYDTNITELPNLPPNLRHLSVADTPLRALPELPHTLKILNVSGSDIIELPKLPPGLLKLRCSENDGILEFPELPKGLKKLDISHSAIEKLPYLPNLKYLYCNNTKITTLPRLSNKLFGLECSNAKLTHLPGLPKTLDTLDCSNNKITEIRSLVCLKFLDCSNNNILALPAEARDLYMTGDLVSEGNPMCEPCRDSRFPSLVEMCSDMFVYTGIETLDTRPRNECVECHKYTVCRKNIERDDESISVIVWECAMCAYANSIRQN